MATFTLAEATKLMGLTPQELQRLIAEGKIMVVRERAGVLVPRESLLAYMATVSKAQGKPV